MTKLEKIVIAALTASLLVSAFILFQRANGEGADIGESSQQTLQIED